MSAPNSPLAGTCQLLRDMATQARESQSVAGGSLTHTVGGWLASEYASSAHEKLLRADGGQRWEVLRAFVRDWSLLRRGDHAAARLQLEPEELKWQRANVRLQKEKDFREWIKRPEIREKFLPKSKQGITKNCLDATREYPEVRERFREAFELFQQQRAAGAAPNQT
jgi:hypothetical protein